MHERLASCISGRRVAAMSILRLAVLLGLAFGASPPPASAAAEANSPSAPVTCVRAWPEARYRNYGYDHIVHVLSRCRLRAICDVSTSVRPEPIRVRIAPREHQRVLTFRGSPRRQFIPNVQCWLDEARAR